MAAEVIYTELLYIALIVGGFCRLLYLKTKIPYPVIVILAGFVLGTLDSFIANKFINSMVQGWVAMKPKLLLCVFMPSIVFESALFSNYRIVANSIRQILFIAVPLAGLSIIVTILYEYLVFPYKWTWNEFSLLGSIVWAIEPTPMLPILEEIGVAKELGHLVETAALWSDGTILASFYICNDLAATNSTVTFDAVVTFLRQICGGFLIGYAFAIILLYFIQKNKDDLTSVIVSIAVVYLTFYVAEVTAVHVSGVVSVMVIGQQLSSIDIMKQTQSSLLLHTWRLLGYICNTLVLFLCGLIVAEQALFKNPHPINFTDIGHLIAFYVSTNVIRFLMITFTYPFFKKLGYPFDFKSVTLIIWSDLRGSVAIVLTMLILDSNSTISDDVYYRILFYSCGMTTLTTIINCGTVKYLVNFLKLVDEKPFSYSIYSSCQQLLQNYNVEEMNYLKKSHYLIHANWSKVASMLPKIAPRNVDQQFSHAEQKIENTILDNYDLAADQTFEEKEDIVESRKRYLILLQSKYWELYNYRAISKSSVYVLLTGVYKSLDRISSPLDQWRYYEERLSSASCIHQVLKDNKLYHKLFSSSYFNQILESWEVVVTFLLAHKQIRRPYKAMVKMADNILSETIPDFNAAMKYINILIKSNKELMETIHTFRALEILLRSNQLLIKKLYKKGEIDEKNVDKLQSSYEEIMEHIKKDFYSTKLLAINDLLFKRTIFANIHSDHRALVMRKVSQYYYLPNTYVYEQDDPNTNLYILVEGLIEIEFNIEETENNFDDEFENIELIDDKKKKNKKNKKNKKSKDDEDDIIDLNINQTKEKIESDNDEINELDRFNLKLLYQNDDDKLFDRYLGAGTILGGLSMMCGMKKEYSTKVITRCCCFSIQQSDILELFKKDAHFESEFCKHLAYTEARFFDDLIALSENELKEIIEKSVLHKPTKGSQFNFSDYCILFSGQITGPDELSQPIDAFYAFWGSEYRNYTASDNCRILEVPLPNEKLKPKRKRNNIDKGTDLSQNSDQSDYAIRHDLFPFDDLKPMEYVYTPSIKKDLRHQYSNDDIDIGRLRKNNKINTRRSANDPDAPSKHRARTVSSVYADAINNIDTKYP